MSVQLGLCSWLRYESCRVTLLFRGCHGHWDARWVVRPVTQHSCA